jgi:hypothetical protein
MLRASRLALGLFVAFAGCADDGASTESAGQTGAETTTTAASDVTTGGASLPTTGGPGQTGAETTTTAASDTAATGVASTTGDATTGDATTSDTTTDDATGSTTASTGDDTSTGGDDPVVAVAPAWLRALDGLTFTQRVAALPDGDVVALLTGGLYAKEIVVAQGGADEQVLPTMILAPALARFDGATGALEEARMLAERGEGTPYGASVQLNDLDVADNGDLLVVGTWFGLAEFFPDSPDSETMLAEIKLNGNNLDRAEEPFFFRMTPDGDVTWLVRGRTPPGLQTTWFNYGKGIAGLPGGDVVIAGEYEQSGFVVAHGEPGAKTMTGSQSSYFARLGGDGSPVWVYRNTTRLPQLPLKSGADGAIYSILPADATIFADADMPTTTASEPGLATAVFGRVAPDGGLQWTVNVAKADPSPLWGYEIAGGGDLLLYGVVDGEVVLRDAGGEATSAQTDAAQAWIAGLDPAGDGLWIRALGPTVTAVGPAIAGADGVWLVARISAPHEVEVAGVPTPLPALGYGPEATATALLRIDSAGEVTAVQVIGADLPIASLAWSGPDQGSFLALAGYYCGIEQPSVVAAGGAALEPLAFACDMRPLDDSRGYVAAIPRVP